MSSSTIARLLIALLLMLPALRATAVLPEAGTYWDPNEPGLGYFIENQRGIVIFIAYAYEADGTPTFYTGSGTLQEGFGEILGTGYPFLTDVGYVPWHFVPMDLYRTTGGPCLTCDPKSTTSERVGKAWLYFDRETSVTLEIILDSGPTTQRRLIRFAYAFAPPAVHTGDRYALLQDVLGEWVFVDESDSNAPALRYTFSTREQSVSPIDQYTPVPWTVTFVDPSKNARFVCTREPGGGLSPPPNLLNSACELLQDGVPLFWAIMDDVGVDQIIASTGTTLPIVQAYRGDGQILGRRIK